jgi:hypothetical protein
VSGKQHYITLHGSFEVKLVHNAMESFQQKVPPILFGAFEDSFDWKIEETTGTVGFYFSSTGEGSVLRHRLTINVTRFNTHVHKHGWRNIVREIDLFQEWHLILTSFERGTEEPRHYASLINTCWEYRSDFNHQHFWIPPRDSVGLFLGGNCPQHCKQDLPKKVGEAAHAVIQRKRPYFARVICNQLGNSFNWSRGQVMGWVFKQVQNEFMMMT